LLRPNGLVMTKQFLSIEDKYSIDAIKPNKGFWK
jgi:hypothetical protein